ncbi:arsenate reductase ArsC [Candidatus Margulisiibacteriota bacterium]
MAKKKILFACIGNCCRSQMAEGFARKLAGDKLEIYSAGSKPAGFVHPEAIAAMKEIGIDISKQFSKGFQQVPQDLDYVITMGCGEDCPLVAAKVREDWQIMDPIGQPLSVFQFVRDDLGKKVKAFLASQETA